ncbi:hypothetical protein ACLQ2R_17120 [Streptosporangium sp. DT93]|uniref:hypothetical protein n=1 Tax=Streptosporangium sp. DT93 TaxID=3393428 RepID=UPI003CF558A4
MSLLILSLIIAAIVCGILWRRPDARAAASGAWSAGRAQAAREFREGYQFAQERLRRGDPSWKNPRRWASWGLASGYGAAKTLIAGGRICRAAWQGARERYAEWKAAQPIDAEVIEVVVEPDPQQDAPEPEPEPAAEPDPAEPEAEADAPPPPDASEPTDSDPNPGSETQQEEPTMQTEATGLTSYAAAHAQFANELRGQMSGSENLASSMKDVLAEHSDLIGDTAVLQDLLNQAAGIADRIAERAIAVASN